MMQMSQLIRRVGPVDVKVIRRDSFLIFMATYAFIIAMALRYLLPWANVVLAETGVLPGDRFDVSLKAIYPMLIAYLGFYAGSLLVGTIFGFMLLDEKDHNTLTAMMVTPVSLEQYALYRVGLPAILASLIILIMLLIINIALLPLWQLILLCLAGGLTAPIVSLFFATFAENKVQGFAFSKFTGVSGLVIMIGWFVSEPLQWLLGIFPPFWVSKAYWLALEGRSLWWLALIAAVVLQIALIGWLVKRFTRAAYR